MNLMDRKLQEEFFQDYLYNLIPQKSRVRLSASSYDEEWSAMRYETAAGPLVLRINESDKPEEDVAHRTAFVARLLSECPEGAAEEYIRKTKSLFDETFADFDAPLSCPGGAEIYAWDSTGKIWPRPFYIRRWMEGPNLAAAPKRRYFRQAGLALRRFHRLKFPKYYAGFKAVAQGKPAKTADIFKLDAAISAVEAQLPLVLLHALQKLPHDANAAETGLVSKNFFGNNIMVDNLGRVRVTDWEKAGIGDFSQDFFPLKYWTLVHARSGWYVPDAELFSAFCEGYGLEECRRLAARPEHLYLEAQWLLRRLGAAARRWADGRVQEPYPEPDFYVHCLKKLLGV
ncbi:MAG: phosphotransferase [Alphaproteobacteria bacterium]|nr:phosphotransferase [Alphaproteobacteria bacterium]